MKLRSIKQITDILSEIGALLDSHISFKLMQPNVILAIAGIKPIADMSEINPNSTTISKLPEINKILNKHSLDFYIIQKQESIELHGGYFGGIISLKGLERTTHLSKFPFMIKFNDTNDIEKYIKWKDEMKIVYQRELNNRNYNDKEISIIRQGIQMGYPDQAIQDLIYFYKLDKDKGINIDFYIRNLNETMNKTFFEKVKSKEIFIKANLYIPTEYIDTSPLPRFTYLYKNINQEEISNWIRNANNILMSFYNSEWYKIHRVSQPNVSQHN